MHNEAFRLRWHLVMRLVSMHENIQTANYLGEFLRRRLILFPITEVAKSPHHDFAR
jgi:hypothetical protein